MSGKAAGISFAIASEVSDVAISMSPSRSLVRAAIRASSSDVTSSSKGTISCSGTVDGASKAAGIANSSDRSGVSSVLVVSSARALSSVLVVWARASSAMMRSASASSYKSEMRTITGKSSDSAIASDGTLSAGAMAGCVCGGRFVTGRDEMVTGRINSASWYRASST